MVFCIDETCNVPNLNNLYTPPVCVELALLSLRSVRMTIWLHLDSETIYILCFQCSLMENSWTAVNWKVICRFHAKTEKGEPQNMI